MFLHTFRTLKLGSGLPGESGLAFGAGDVDLALALGHAQLGFAIGALKIPVFLRIPQPFDYFAAPGINGAYQQDEFIILRPPTVQVFGKHTEYTDQYGNVAYV